MDNKIKSAWLLITTLLLGILIGVLVHSSFMMVQNKRMYSFSRHDGFIRRMLQVIAPNEQQKSRVTVILSQSGKQFEKLNEDHRRKMRQQMDSLILALTPVLDSAQIQNLKKFNNQSRLRWRKKQEQLPETKRK